MTNDDYEHVLTDEEQTALREALSISWKYFRVTARHIGTKAALFRTKKVLPEFIYDMAALEENPYTFPEVQTLLEGITVGGRKLSDQEQILTIRDAWHHVLKKVSSETFEISKEVLCETQALVAKYEALEQGAFRTMAMNINGTQHQPPAFEKLDEIFQRGLTKLKSLRNVHERAYALFL